MPITNLEIATRARNLLTERSSAAVNITIPHLVGLIPTVMEQWVRVIETDPEKRAYLVKEFTPTAAAGVLDLTNYINGTSGKISLHDLRNSVIYTTISGVPTPMTWVGSRTQLNFPRVPSGAPAVYLDGTTLRTRNTDGSLTSLAGSVSFNVVSYPSSAADLPPALLGDFVTHLANSAVKEKIVDGN